MFASNCFFPLFCTVFECTHTSFSYFCIPKTLLRSKLWLKTILLNMSTETSLTISMHKLYACWVIVFFYIMHLRVHTEEDVQKMLACGAHLRPLWKETCMILKAFWMWLFTGGTVVSIDLCNLRSLHDEYKGAISTPRWSVIWWLR